VPQDVAPAVAVAEDGVPGLLSSLDEVDLVRPSRRAGRAVVDGLRAHRRPTARSSGCTRRGPVLEVAEPGRTLVRDAVVHRLDCLLELPNRTAAGPRGAGYPRPG
jgi:hypothetical protein